MRELPWGDCKVAFGVDSFGDDDEGGDTFSRIEKLQLPRGWTFDGEDGSGARLVAIFRVEGPLRVKDGARVRATLKKAGLLT